MTDTLLGFELGIVTQLPVVSEAPFVAPVGQDECLVTGEFGEVSGMVQITQMGDIVDPTSNELIPEGPLPPITLVNGAFSISLLCTPPGVLYALSIVLDGRPPRFYTFSLPATLAPGPINILTLVNPI